MSLNDSMNELERSKLAVWDYPVSDKYTKMWQSMKEAGLPQTFDEALERVRNSTSNSEGFAFLGKYTYKLRRKKNRMSGLIKTSQRIYACYQRIL